VTSGPAAPTLEEPLFTKVEEEVISVGTSTGVPTKLAM